MTTRNDYGVMQRPGLFAAMYPVAALQYFNFSGGGLVYMDSSGHITLGLTATDKLWGYAEIPKGASYESNQTYWLSSSTAGLSKILVYPFCANPGLLFKMPTILASTSTGLCVAARVGELCDIVAVNDGTRQYAVPGTSSTDVLQFVALCEYVGPGDSDTDAAFFTFNDAETQKDT
jgi:hypothetical protein